MFMVCLLFFVVKVGNYWTFEYLNDVFLANLS